MTDSEEEVLHRTVYDKADKALKQVVEQADIFAGGRYVPGIPEMIDAMHAAERVIIDFHEHLTEAEVAHIVLERGPDGAAPTQDPA